ncbi:MAG: hypothetical protein ACOH12_01340 [Parvibaculaceae bacterium]
MTNTTRKTAFKATAIALVAATSMTLAAPAFADGRHGGGNGNWHWSDQQRHGGYGNGYGHDRGRSNHDGLAAVAILGGVILGAALLSQPRQPAYQQPVYQQPVYAPAPAYGSSYGYDQQPLQATPSSDIYQTQSGQYCREYQSQVNVGGRMQYGYGTACQQPDGSWRVVN